jgi:hypothetical protein
LWNNIRTSGNQKNKIVTNHTNKYFESQRFVTVGRVREANNFFNFGPTVSDIFAILCWSVSLLEEAKSKVP